MGNRLNFSWWHTYLFNRCDPSLGTQIDEEYQKYLKVQNTCTYSSVNDGCSGDIDGTAEVTWTNLSRITDLVNVKVAVFENDWNSNQVRNWGLFKFHGLQCQRCSEFQKKHPDVTFDWIRLKVSGYIGLLQMECRRLTLSPEDTNEVY